MTDPQPMKVRRGGAKRGEHGSYVAPDAARAASPAPVAAGTIGTDTTPAAATRPRRVGKPITAAQAAAKVAYDAKPKVIFRGVDEDVYHSLRAIYKHQLHTAEGIEGWSEFGRHLLRNYVDQYEQVHGEMAGGEEIELPTGRPMR